MDSILTSTKKLLGLVEEYTAFDEDIITYINSAFMTLRQLGVGPKDGFFIEDKTATWNDYSNDRVLINMVKPYLYLKTKLSFDPPTSSIAMESLKQAINESEWRMNIEFDKEEPTNE